MTERELFDLLKKNAINNILSVSGKQKTTDVINQEFDKMFDVLMASREGCKLVPVEPADETIAHITNTPIEVNLLCDNADVFLSESEAYIAYKAMIGAYSADKE